MEAILVYTINDAVEMTLWVREYLLHKHENQSLESHVNSGVT